MDAIDSSGMVVTVSVCPCNDLVCVDGCHRLEWDGGHSVCVSL